MWNFRCRFPDDVYDRIWEPTEWAGDMRYISTNQTINTNNRFDPPRAVMSTAVTPTTASRNINFTLQTSMSSGRLYYTYVHLSELQILAPPNQTRGFNIYLNNELFFGPYSPAYLSLMTLWARDPHFTKEFKFSMQRTVNSTLPPLLNAYEIYTFDPLPQSETATKDGMHVLV